VFSAKFIGYNESGIVFQWKNLCTGSMGLSTEWCDQLHGGPAGGADQGHGGAWPTRGAMGAGAAGTHKTPISCANISSECKK
jgi:hypothetical protein